MKKLLVIAILFIGVGAVTLLGFLVQQSGRSGSNKSVTTNTTPIRVQPTPTRIPYPEKGEFMLNVDARSKQVGDSVVVIVKATTEPEQLVGYDLILSYDDTAFAVEAVESLKTEFRVYPYQRSGYLAVSSTKDMNAQAPTILRNDLLLKITFKSKKVGDYSFALEQKGNENSKYVNEKAEVRYVRSEPVSIAILQ